MENGETHDAVAESLSVDLGDVNVVDEDVTGLWFHFDVFSRRGLR